MSVDHGYDLMSDVEWTATETAVFDIVAAEGEYVAKLVYISRDFCL
jgi:hypothetical protein